MGIVLVLFIPTIVSLGVAEGFVSSAVIMMHLYYTAEISVDLLINELALMTIGFGMGLIVRSIEGARATHAYRVAVKKRGEGLGRK